MTIEVNWLIYGTLPEIDFPLFIQDTELNRQLQHFKCYNREKELERREMERKEHDWEQELIKAMNASTIPAMQVHMFYNELKSIWNDF